MRPAWRFLRQRPLDAPAPFDGLRVREILLRCPPGNLPGGEMLLERVDGEKVVDRRVVALEPGEAQVLVDGGVAALLRELLGHRGEVPEGAVEAPARVAPSEPETPGLRLG